MSTEPTVTIPKSKYDDLVRSAEMLAALEAGGVDNWEWYSESLAGFFDDDEDDDE